MNLALQLLEDQRQPLALEKYHIPQALTSVILTPRFKASSHIVYLVLGMGSPDPLLVVKVPRLAGTSRSIYREARNLRLVQATRPGGFDSTPRLVAHQIYHNREILVETALAGQAMDPSAIRQDLAKCCDLTLRWLLDVAQASRRAAKTNPGWFERLVEQPLDQMSGLLFPNELELHLIDETRKLAAALEDQDIPLVFEHGDLSHPNIFLLKQGGIGVVDWEQAEPEGLPGADLFFFLTYAAFARRQARTQNEYLQAYQSAFFGKDAWAVPYIQAYARQLDLRADGLAPFLLLTWPRYLSALSDRLMSSQASNNAAAKKNQEWLRANRYHALWQFTMDHFNELDW